MFVYTVGIQESVNKIFGGILVGALRKDNENYLDIIRATKVNRNKFIGTFPSNIFQNEYAIFYDIIVGFNAKVFTLNELDAIIFNNRDIILNSPLVDLSSVSFTGDMKQTTDDEKIEAIKLNMQDMLIGLSNLYVSEDEFESACAIFINWFRNEYMLDVSQSMARIMSADGLDEKVGKRNRHYSGYADCREYYSRKIRILDELADEASVRSSIIDSKWLENEMQDEGKEDKDSLIAIGIKEIDDEVGELRRGDVLGILGPPKGGKTRFTNYIASRALSKGLNICIWSLEGTQKEWESMQIAALIRREQNISMSSKYILQRMYRGNERDRGIVMSAKIRMATAPDLGRISFITGTAYVEDFIEIIKSHYNSINPFDVLIIDQLIDIQSKTGIGKVDRISTAYQDLKQFLAYGLKRPALGIMPAQLKQSVVDFIRKNPNETIDVTAGGESAETIRTPDEVIGLFSSKEERAANISHVYSVASRHSASFEDFRMRSEFKCCYFESDPSLNQ